MIQPLLREHLSPTSLVCRLFLAHSRALWCRKDMAHLRPARTLDRGWNSRRLENHTIAMGFEDPSSLLPLLRGLRSCRSLSGQEGVELESGCLPRSDS